MKVKPAGVRRCELETQGLWFIVTTLAARCLAGAKARWGRQVRSTFSLSNLFGEAVAMWWRMRKLR
ncbi:MAG: hypothetical protein ACUVSP_07845 [Desulfotomaculales bacterium]